MKHDIGDYPRITRDELLSGICRTSSAWAADFWFARKVWPVFPHGDSPVATYYSECLDAFDRPIEQLMLDVLCLLLDAGRCWTRWQFFVWSHLAGLLARHPLGPALAQLPLQERLQFQLDLAALGLSTTPTLAPIWEPAVASGLGGVPAEALRSALSQAMIERNRNRWVASEGWRAVDPGTSVAAQAYNQLRRDAAPPLERLTLAIHGFFLDMGLSDAAWQHQVWQHIQEALDGQDLESLLQQVAKPWYRNELLSDLSHLGLCPAALDPHRPQCAGSA